MLDTIKRSLTRLINPLRRTINGIKAKRDRKLYERAEEVCAKLAVELAIATQMLIQSALTEKNYGLINMHTAGSTKLSTSLSPLGIERLARNLPESVATLLKKEKANVLFQAMAIVWVPMNIPGQSSFVPPFVQEIVARVLQNELQMQKRFPE